MKSQLMSQKTVEPHSSQYALIQMKQESLVR